MRESMIYNPCIYQLREKSLKRMLAIINQRKLAKRDEMVFFGDSIIEFYDVNKYFKNYNIYNCGIAGATTDLLLSIIDEAVIQYYPRKVLIQVGTNDLGNTVMHSPRVIALNIAEIVRIIKHNLPNCEVYVLCPLPCLKDQEWIAIRHNSFINNMKIYLNEYVENAIIFDIFDEMLYQEQFYKDGLHPSDEGYEIITKKILEIMKL